MANGEQAHARAQQLRALMEARVAAEAAGEVTPAELQVAHDRNAALRALAEAMAAGDAAPRRTVNHETWPSP